MPSDHIIDNNKSLLSVIKTAKLSSLKHSWILFGVKPTHPSVSYGYIKTSNSEKISKVQKFEEKPSINKAERYYKDKT